MLLVKLTTYSFKEFALNFEMRKSVEAILREQAKEGIFPTYRARKGEVIVELPETRVDNIGIHTFVLEKLAELYPQNQDVRDAFSKGLDFLLQDSVILSDSRLVWRWLKHPLKEDWLYPADADDTARARIVIELAKTNGFQIPQEFQDFDYSKFVNEGMTPLGGRLTFIDFKPDDSLCPVVNMNLLHALKSALSAKGEDINQNKAYSNNYHLFAGRISCLVFLLLLR